MKLNSQREDITMSSKRAQGFVHPLAQGKMARLEDPMGNMGPPEFPKADNPPRYSQDKTLPFRQTYMSCSHSGKEALEHHSPWSSSRTYVQNRGSPVVHPSVTEGSITSQLNFRPEDAAFPLDSGSPAGMEDLAAKHRFAYYSRSPNDHSPHVAEVVSPVAFRKPPVGCPGLSPPTAEISVGLAIPKPVYGHRPCCAGRKCTVGHNFAVEEGLHRAPPPVFEEDWAAHYGHWAYVHRKEQEALMQQRILQFEPCLESVPLKDVTTEGYHGHRPRRASAFTEPGRGRYISSPARPLLPSPPEHCQQFQMPSQMHSNLRPVYEPLTQMHYGLPAQVYQDRPLTSKYMEMTRHPFLYCPQKNIEIYRPENSHIIIDKQTSGQCPLPQTYFSDLPKPYSVVPGHSAIRNVVDYSTYRMHLNTSETVNQMNPINKRPCPHPAMQQVERPLDFSLRREQKAGSYRSPHGQFGSFHPTQAQCRVSADNPTLSCSDKGQDVFSASSICNHTTTTRFTGEISNRRSSYLSDKSTNNVSLSRKHRVEIEDICKTNYLGKVQKLDKQQTEETQAPPSPPMPVINKVFSLAPYKVYLETTGMLSAAQDPSISELQAADSVGPRTESEAQSQDDLKSKSVTVPPATSYASAEIQILKVKEEKIEEDEASCQSEMTRDLNPAVSHHAAHVKEEPGDLESPVCSAEHNATDLKTEIKPEHKTVTPEISEPTEDEPSAVEGVETVPTQNIDTKSSVLPNTLPSKSPAPSQTPQRTFSLNSIPPQCLKLTSYNLINSYNIIVPEVLRSPVPPVPEVLQSPVEPKPAVSSSRQARHQFVELHQTLCALVARSVPQTSHQELRNWLSRLDLVSPPSKTQKVTCLLGSKAREAWLRSEETEAALQKVLGQLEKYVRNRECPFLHVIRAGTVFIPMLVVKEALFPQVQGTFIDQVLQEHRIELRPTTLSEERHLTQLHRRSFSSKLRRLLSLKHLPDMYPDVLNLLYYASVCKFLGIESNCMFKKECVEFIDENENSIDGLEVRAMSQTPHPSNSVKCVDNDKEASCITRHKGKGRVKSACKRAFLGDDSSTSEDEPKHEFENWCSNFEKVGWEIGPTACSDEDSHIVVKIEEDNEPENSWGRPLTSDDLSDEGNGSVVETASCSSSPSWLSGRGATPSITPRRADMVLKLRKVYHSSDLPHYQRVTDHPEAQHTAQGGQTHLQGSVMSYRSSRYRIRPTARDLSPYLSTQHASKSSRRKRRRRRRRRAMRSALHDARRPSDSYPDLVGKRIRHLYEENDKTEVWYRGVVLRIHEPHPNPLKTVFEVKYDSEPEWQYYLELLVDYKKGWLKIEE